MSKLLVAVIALSFFALIPSTARAAASGEPQASETAKAVADGGLDAMLAGKVTAIEGADRRCGNDKGGFAFNTKSKKIWQTGDDGSVGLELTVKSLSAGDQVQASASLENLVQYSFSGNWSDLTVKLAGDGEEETFKLSCK